MCVCACACMSIFRTHATREVTEDQAQLWSFGWEGGAQAPGCYSLGSLGQPQAQSSQVSSPFHQPQPPSSPGAQARGQEVPSRAAAASGGGEALPTRHTQVRALAQPRRDVAPANHRPSPRKGRGAGCGRGPAGGRNERWLRGARAGIRDSRPEGAGAGGRAVGMPDAAGGRREGARASPALSRLQKGQMARQVTSSGAVPRAGHLGRPRGRGPAGPDGGASSQKWLAVPTLAEGVTLQ